MNPSGWDWSTLLRLELGEGAITAEVGPVVWAAVFVAVGLWLILKRPWREWRKRWRPVRFRLALFGLEYEIVPDHENAQVAHEAYVELATRKAAVRFDEEHDSIDEIYDSWYALFGQFRLLTRGLSAHEIRVNAELRRLLDLLVQVLNDGLRPHLTRRQVPFRTWLAEARRSQPAVATPELQKGFPKYDDLVASLRETNEMLQQLAAGLKEMAHGKESA